MTSRSIVATIALLTIISVPAAGSSVWQESAGMQYARYEHTATLMQDWRVLVVGGRDTISASVDKAELFDTTNGRWDWIPTPFSIGPDASAVPLLTGEVLIVGGRANPTGRTVLFEPRSECYSFRHGFGSISR